MISHRHHGIPYWMAYSSPLRPLLRKWPCIIAGWKILTTLRTSEIGVRFWLMRETMGVEMNRMGATLVAVCQGLLPGSKGRARVEMEREKTRTKVNPNNPKKKPHSSLHDQFLDGILNYYVWCFVQGCIFPRYIHLNTMLIRYIYIYKNMYVYNIHIYVWMYTLQHVKHTLSELDVISTPLSLSKTKAMGQANTNILEISQLSVKLSKGGVSLGYICLLPQVSASDRDIS